MASGFIGRGGLAGMVTALGALLSAPVTAYIGLRFTRELRGREADQNTRAEGEQ